NVIAADALSQIPETSIAELNILKRCGTMTNSCKSKNLKFKLDLHIVVLNDGEAVIDGMTAEAMLEDLYLIYETNQIDPNDAIKRVVEESGRKKKLNVKAWTTKVFYNNDYDDLVEDNEEQEQVDEDSDNRNED
ncbi:hypothetical protein CU098_005339, partial [Rhizopus stolonifer]